MVRRKVAEVLDRSGPEPAQPLRQGPAGDPGDLPARRAVPDHHRRPLPRGDRRAADGRAPAAAAVPAPRRVRPVHLLPGLPAAGPVHHRRTGCAMQEILLRELNGVGVDYTTRVTESMLARVHFIVRTDPANPPGDIDVDALAEQLADATRLWDDDFRLVLERKLGDEQAKRAVHPVRRRVPGGLQGRAHAVRGGQGPRQAGAARGARPAGDAPVPQEPRRRPTCGSRSSGTASRWCSPPCCRCCTRSACGSTDERPYEVEPRRRHRSTSTTSACSCPPAPASCAEVRPHVENAFAAAWRGEAEVDGFNAAGAARPG